MPVESRAPPRPAMLPLHSTTGTPVEEPLGGDRSTVGTDERRRPAPRTRPAHVVDRAPRPSPHRRPHRRHLALRDRPLHPRPAGHRRRPRRLDRIRAADVDRLPRRVRRRAAGHRADQRRCGPPPHPPRRDRPLHPRQHRLRDLARRDDADPRPRRAGPGRCCRRGLGPRHGRRRLHRRAPQPPLRDARRRQLGRPGRRAARRRRRADGLVVARRLRRAGRARPGPHDRRGAPAPRDPRAHRRGRHLSTRCPRPHGRAAADPPLPLVPDHRMCRDHRLLLLHRHLVLRVPGAVRLRRGPLHAGVRLQRVLHDRVDPRLPPPHRALRRGPPLHDRPAHLRGRLGPRARRGRRGDRPGAGLAGPRPRHGRLGVGDPGLDHPHAGARPPAPGYCLSPRRRPAVRPRWARDAARGRPRRHRDRHGRADVRLHRGRARRAAVGVPGSQRRGTTATGGSPVERAGASR